MKNQVFISVLLILYVIRSLAQIEDKEANLGQPITKTVIKQGRKSVKEFDMSRWHGVPVSKILCLRQMSGIWHPCPITVLILKMWHSLRVPKSTTMPKQCNLELSKCPFSICVEISFQGFVQAFNQDVNLDLDRFQGTLLLVASQTLFSC